MSLPSSLDRRTLHAAYAAGLSPVAAISEVHAQISRSDDRGVFLSRPTLADLTATAATLPPFDPAAYPLWGLPVAVKDNIDVLGLPTTAACPSFAYQPTRSATVVEKLQAAGALIVGKTNLDQFATGLVGLRTPYPAPTNPFDPARAPGGSSSGSAVAVARGLVTLALGTDTAGSGRIPAAFNNLVGLKPTPGALSTRGVVPACRTLDCVSIFAATVDDALVAFEALRGFDAEDPYSRETRPILAPISRLGAPRPDDRLFFGDRAMADAYERALAAAATLAAIVEVDMTPFFETARLLYEGPWIAERHAALRTFMAERADDMLPVTRNIVAGGARFSATDLFEAQYRLKALSRAIEPTFAEVDALILPTAPIFPTVAEVAADPIGPNARLGTYTNFVNLLGLSALAAPAFFRADGLPAGVTFVGAADADWSLAAFAERFAHAVGDRRRFVQRTAA